MPGMLLGAAAGLGLDRLLGEMPAERWHPVALFGRWMSSVERTLYRDSLPRGMVYAAAAAVTGMAAGATLRRNLPGDVATAVGCYVAAGGRALHDNAAAVAARLTAGDIDGARLLLPSLVGRDPSHLGPPEIARAVVESVAENTVDAIVAPALWAATLGPVGALVHRAIDTVDSMVGYRSDRYRRFGWAAARLDDLAAWIPARVTAGLVAAVRPRSAGEVLRIVRRDAPAHPSPNAGVAEAAFAAALHVQLAGGLNTYSVGGGPPRIDARPALGDGHCPTPNDVARAIKLSRDVTAALALLLATVGVLMRTSIGARTPR